MGSVVRASSRALQNTMAADLATAATGAYQSLRAFNDSLLKSSAVRNGVNGESSRLACVAERLFVGLHEHVRTKAGGWNRPDLDRGAKYKIPPC